MLVFIGFFSLGPLMGWDFFLWKHTTKSEVIKISCQEQNELVLTPGFYYYCYSLFINDLFHVSNLLMVPHLPFLFYFSTTLYISLFPLFTFHTEEHSFILLDYCLVAWWKEHRFWLHSDLDSIPGWPLKSWASSLTSQSLSSSSKIEINNIFVSGLVKDFWQCKNCLVL